MTCKIISAAAQVIPSRAKHLLLHKDLSNSQLMSELLSAVFMATPTLPCSAAHEVLGAAAFAVQSAVAQEKYKKGQEEVDTVQRKEDLRRTRKKPQTSRVRYKINI